MTVDMAAYAEALMNYNGRLDQHEMGTVVGCEVDDHCHIHHVDEPSPSEMGLSEAYRTCGECFHVWLNETDIMRDDVLIRTQVWQADLRATEGPLDHSGAPVAQPGSDIHTCPLCAHDF